MSDRRDTADAPDWDAGRRTLPEVTRTDRNTYRVNIPPVTREAAPRTAAGRALLDSRYPKGRAGAAVPGYEILGDLYDEDHNAILAIEAEAQSQERERIWAALENWGNDYVRAEVLEILDAEAAR